MSLCVVHLVWAPLGPEPVRRFAESYRANAAGAEHTLAVVFNGFDGPGDPRLETCAAPLAGIEHESLRLGAPVLDIAAYLAAAERLGHSTYCFLNSYSRILAPGWLAHMRDALARPGAGLVGATGSWASPSTQLRWELRLGGVYASLYRDRARTIARMQELTRASTHAPPQGGLRRRLGTAHSYLVRAAHFPPFPNPHLRSNGFMVGVDALRGLRPPRDKLGAWRLESGRRSLTRRVLAAGLDVLVVTRDGDAFPVASWPASRTYCSGEQERLLIADNQTDGYAAADAELREILAQFAWGPQGLAPPGS